MPMMKSLVVPYFAARTPLAFVETMPPRVQMLELPGSGGKK